MEGKAAGVARVVESVASVAGSGVPSVVAEVTAFRAALARVDVEGLSDAERVELVAELERVKGAASAVQARATHAARVSREVATPHAAVRSVGSEMALARRESPSLGDRFVGLARALVSEMPETMRALTAGVIGERHAVAVVQATACLSREDRAEVDRRVGPLLGWLGVRQSERAARRVAAELDAASVIARMEAAVASRRVTVRPAPDGMAYLTVLGPLKDVVGAHAALRARAATVVGGQCPEEAPEGRGTGAVAADTALRLLSGRAVGELQPVEVHLVMTDRSLPGGNRAMVSAVVSSAARTPSPTSDGGVDGFDDSVWEPARIPGHGSVPSPVARRWLREGLDSPATAGEDHAGGRAARVWLRRLYVSPDGRDLVAMDSRRRVFTGLLRRMLVLRDDVCVTPWCDAPIVQLDHAAPAREGGATDFGNGSGMCARCNQVKEAPGWSVTVIHPGPGTGVPGSAGASGVIVWVPRKRRPSARRTSLPTRARSRVVEVRTPTGRTHRAQAPPLTGWGWSPPPVKDRGRSVAEGTASALERHLTNLLGDAA